MAFRIQNNIAALNAQRNLGVSGDGDEQIPGETVFRLPDQLGKG